MKCPFCGAADTKVIDTRVAVDGSSVRRRRQCDSCNERFTTYEQADLIMPLIVKSDGTREKFNENKVRNGFTKALEKRPVSANQINNAINNVSKALRAKGEREVPARFVGELVMEELRRLDSVAYIRFASVYLSFSDLKDFGAEIAKLQDKNEKNQK